MKCWLLVMAALLAQGRSLADVEYAQVSGQSLRMDAFIPDGDGPYAAAILVHGGAWVTGDKRRNVRPLFDPLSQNGIAWFSINYRLARGNDPASLISLEGLSMMTSAADDVRSAVAYVQDHAAELHVDPARVVLIGESAGAHLASMAALRPMRAPVMGVVAFYSPSDLVRLVDTSPRIPEALRRSVKGTALEALLLPGLRQLSPQTWVAKDAPPFLMIHGTADMLVPFDQSERMCAALVRAASLCELITVEGAGHGMNFWEGQASMTAYKAAMVGWLKALLQ